MILSIISIGLLISLVYICRTYIFLSTPENLKVYPQFIEPYDAEHLIKLANDIGFKRSTVNGDNNESQISPNRTSQSVSLQDDDPIVTKIKEKVSHLLKCDINKIEQLQVVRYQHGEEYQAHYDADKFIRRPHTILVYLNTLDPGDGGHTIFVKKNLKVAPVSTNAVYFKNLLDNGSIDPDSLHAGEPILREGVIKYALNIWIKE